MTAKIIDGKAIANQTLATLSDRVQKFNKQEQQTPCLAVILVGADPASQIYVRKKHEACQKIGMRSQQIELPASCGQQTLLDTIAKLNADAGVHGILVQLPLPEGYDEGAVIRAIAPEKDVDGFHPTNVGLLAQRQPLLRPCTPFGIMRLLESIDMDLHGVEAVIVGASNIVGRPMALELLLAGATVSVCHRFTRDLASHVQKAELLIAAVGKPELIKGEWIKPGAVVIDVGINRLASGKLQGDVEYEVASERAGWITPVPGGVGPMTVAMLLENTLLAAERSAQLDG